MSGQHLRKAASKGDYEQLKEYITKKANTCSADEFGLSPLHFAVWNGHVECVKLLICNSWGVDCHGVKCKNISLTTCMGLTALHLAAMETPKLRAKEITLLLLIIGIDQLVVSSAGQTAEEIAESNNNVPVLEAFREFRDAKEDKVLRVKLQGILSMLASRYSIQVLFKTRGAVNPLEIKQHFNIPDFLLEEQEHFGNIPEGMTIHEHQIKPLTNLGFQDMSGAESLQCLQFSREQALINIQRREQLCRTFDKDFVAVKTSV